MKKTQTFSLDLIFVIVLFLVGVLIFVLISLNVEKNSVESEENNQINKEIDSIYDELKKEQIIYVKNLDTKMLSNKNIEELMYE